MKTKNLVAVIIVIVLALCATSAFAQESAVTPVTPCEQVVMTTPEEVYLETLIKGEQFVICRDRFGTEYDNSAERKPLVIKKEFGRYLVHFYPNPDNQETIATRYFHDNEIEIVFEEAILEPVMEEITVKSHFRYMHNRKDSRTVVKTVYRLTLPADTILDEE